MDPLSRPVLFVYHFADTGTVLFFRHQIRLYRWIISAPLFQAFCFISFAIKAHSVVLLCFKSWTPSSRELSVGAATYSAAHVVPAAAACRSQYDTSRGFRFRVRVALFIATVIVEDNWSY